jgi:archaellum biogenesis ATPase FlaH
MELREKQSRDGIIISRVFPDRLRQRYGFDRSEFLWLSYEKTEKSIDPSDLEKLEYLIHEFVSSHENAVVLLDGVEYLILQNSFESTLKFLQSLNDQIILNGATLIMPLDPKSLDRKELSLLERELETYQVDYRLSRFFE